MKAFFISYFHRPAQPAFRRMVGLAVLLFCLAAQPLHGGPPPVILAFGDSLTAGFGVAEKNSYPARLQEILKRHGHSYRIVNAGVTGDTTAGGLRRIDWLLRLKPAIVILELGANDGLRGLPLSEMRANLEKIIRRCREANARVLLAGMKIPPNYGGAYTREFEATFDRLAETYRLNYIPFFLEGVAAKRELTQADGIHPLGPGYKIVAETVWNYLEPML
ncbi:MAG: arylesterase [Nitrospinales bacterium]